MATLLNGLLKRLREKQARLSLAKLSEQTGIQKSMLAKYENGDVKKPPVEVTTLLCKQYSVEPRLERAMLGLVDNNGSLPDSSVRARSEAMAELVGAMHDAVLSWEGKCRTLVVSNPGRSLFELVARSVYSRTELAVSAGALLSAAARLGHEFRSELTITENRSGTKGDPIRNNLIMFHDVFDPLDRHVGDATDLDNLLLYRHDGKEPISVSTDEADFQLFDGHFARAQAAEMSEGDVTKLRQDLKRVADIRDKWRRR